MQICSVLFLNLKDFCFFSITITNKNEDNFFESCKNAKCIIIPVNIDQYIADRTYYQINSYLILGRRERLYNESSLRHFYRED